jgi:predicted metal-dependent phosphotriesterase family hydrolase
MWHLFYQSASKVVVWGLILGAGLPALFAVGVRSMILANDPQGATQAGVRAVVQPTVNRIVAVVCFVLVVVAVVLGITIIVAAGLGKQVSFEHVLPTLVPKS